MINTLHAHHQNLQCHVIISCGEYIIITLHSCLFMAKGIHSGGQGLLLSYQVCGLGMCTLVWNVNTSPGMDYGFVFR